MLTHRTTTDGDASDHDGWWHIMTTDGGTSWLTYGVTHGCRRTDTLELQNSLLISIRNNGNCPSRDFVHPQVGAPLGPSNRRPGRAQREPGPITTGGDHGSPLSRGRQMAKSSLASFGQNDVGFVSPKRAALPRPHAEEH